MENKFEATLTLLRQGKSQHEIIAILGMSQRYVKDISKMFYSRKHKTNIRIAEITRMISDGMSIKDIATKYNIRKTAIYNFCKRHNIHLPKQHNTSAKNSSIYNPSDIIVSQVYPFLENRTLSYGKIAKMFGVSRQRIHKIAKRRMEMINFKNTFTIEL